MPSNKYEDSTVLKFLKKLINKIFLMIGYKIIRNKNDSLKQQNTEEKNSSTLRDAKGKYALDDTFLKSKFVEIVNEYNIRTIVETGIHRGESTLELTYMVDKVIGIEILEEAIDTTRQNLISHNRVNFELHQGSSPEVLSLIMPTIEASSTIFFFDAHWQSYWPINDEIKQIPKNQGIIIVHDFVVPDHPELGFDFYDEQPFTYEFIKDSLLEWSPTHRVEYNSRSNGSRRGVGYIYPN